MTMMSWEIYSLHSLYYFIVISYILLRTLPLHENDPYSRCQRKSCRTAKAKAACLKLPKQISFHNITLSNSTIANKALFRMSLARSYSNDRYHFDISAGNEKGDFKVKSSTRIKRPTGVVYTAGELTGPADYVIDLSLKLFRQRRWSTFISRLYVFVSKHKL